ncbi:uncharacterized protein LOC122402878 [Colletes gigas]|uniref:uncharacterized protein LOC122402878 n=1 Tax=Colletes gigas TaxID=935657 RepID=UPI001C9BB54F|nr:uncharacterized protein LOC122402878 [Colletes gigas]
MNSVLSTSPFANFEDPTRNGTLHAEARLLQQLSKTNGCLARNQKFPRNEALLQNLQNLPPEEEYEITLTVTSSSVSRLQGKTVQSGTTVAKVHSKTTLKKKEPKNSRFPLISISRQKDSAHGSDYIDSQKHATSSRDFPSRKNEVSKENYDRKTVAPNSLDFKVLERNSRSSKKQETQLSSNNTRNAEDRTIGTALFSCPFELIEIYPGNKDQSSSFNRRSSEVSREGSSMRSFPKEDDETSKSSVLEEDIYLFSKARSKKTEEVCQIDENKVKCTRRNEKDCVESFYESTSGVLQNGDSSGQPTRDRGKIDRSSKQLETNKNVNSVRSGLKRKEEEKMANDVSKKTLEDPRTIEDENQSVVSSSSRESNVFNSDTHYENSVSSSGSGISKLMIDSDRSSTYERSESDVSSMENTVIDLREKKSNSERKNVNTDENNTKIIIDKREIEKNGIVDSNKIGSCNEDSRISEITKDRGFEKGSRFAMKDSGDRNRLNVNGDVKICKLLMEIHEHLSSDWQRMECIRAKQDGGVSVDSLCSKMTLQLLNSTIERCKSYIYGSSNSHKAELKITKLFSKHVIQLVNAVNQNKLIIEEHERQLNSMQSKEIVREQGGNKKRGILNEDSFWDRWTCEISCAIGSIFKLIKCVMTMNEEKENVQNQQQCKLRNCRGTNASSANDKKQKCGVVRSKMADLNPTKKKSSIETQMTVAFNSNNPLKQSKSKASVRLVSPRNLEKEKFMEATQNRVEKKVSDNGRHTEKKRVAKKTTLSANFSQSKQMAPRQKHRVSGNPQPVWRPGGSVKLPSSSSATTLTQKYRPFAKEKGNQPVENTKEAKQSRAISEFKKKVSQETYSKDVFPTLETDACKISRKRSNASLRASPRLKPRPGTLGVATQGYSEPLRNSESVCSKNSEKTSSWEKIARQKTQKESRVLRVLEEIIKSTPIEKRGSKKIKNVVDCYRVQVETNSPQLEQTIKEETKIQEEEPTRDVDSSRPENHRSMGKLLEQPLTYDVTPLFTNVKENTTDEEVSVKIENSQQNADSSFVSVVSASCMADFSSSSDCVAKIESSKCCQTSLNSGSSSCTSNPEQRDERSRKRSNLRVSFVNCIEDRQRCNGESCRNSIVVREEKNLSVVGEEMSENSTLFKEKKDSSIVKVENLKDSIREEICNPLVNEEILKSLSTSKEEKSSNPSIVKLENIKDPICKEVCKNPPVGEEMLKSLPTSKEEKSEDVLVTRKEKSSNPSIVKVENLKNATIREEKPRNPLSLKVEKSITNPHTTSLTMLKEFLYNQGVDIDLVNKAEQCLKDKQRIRRRLKQISASSVDVSSSVHGSKGKLRRVVESNEDDVNHADKLRHVATSTEKNSKDAFSHTGFQCTTKSLQTIPEENTFASTKRQNIGTQTEIATVKHVASECREKMTQKTENLMKNTRNVSTMTDSFPISDNFTETVRVSCVSKSVATERVDFSTSSEKCNDSLEKSTRKDDRGSLNKCRHELCQLLSQTQRDEQNESSSSSLDLSFEYLEEIESNKLAEVISSETMAALRVAEIQARNVYRAIDIYKRHLKVRSNELEDQTEETTNKDFESCKEILECLYKSNDFDIVVTRSYDRLGSDEDREASEASIDRENKSERVISKFVSTSNVPFDEDIFGEIDSEIPRKSSSSVVLKDTRSLVEFLVHETENATIEQIRCTQKISNSKNLRFRKKISKTNNGKLRNRFLLFSRENVLPLVYGVVCSIVFWCLQFTITCDIVA